MTAQAGIEDMNKRTMAVSLLILLCLVCVGYALWCYPRLPGQVAHHFGASGEPDAWGSKIDFLRIYFVAVGIVSATFLGLGLAIPKMPDSLISLPNNDYWLVPERRRQTLDFILTQLLLFGSLTLLLLLYMFHQSVMVNIGRTTELNHAWIATGAYLALTAVWCIRFHMRFSKRES